MAWSQDWYRASGFELMGAANLDEFLAMAEGFFADWVPADLYHQTLSWMAADVSAHPKFEGDLAAALGAIKAATTLLVVVRPRPLRTAVSHAHARETSSLGSTPPFVEIVCSCPGLANHSPRATSPSGVRKVGPP